MPSGPRIILDNAYYHITTRANQKQTIFIDDQDFMVYLARVKKYKKRHGFKLYGYCLMPNHAHMLGKVDKKENLSKFMHDLNRSYTAYFNEKYKKVGYLWQGRFNSKIILKDRYLLDCINYIELNPLRANMVVSPIDYAWSSYKERNLEIYEENNGILNRLEL